MLMVELEYTLAKKTNFSVERRSGYFVLFLNYFLILAVCIMVLIMMVVASIKASAENDNNNLQISRK